MELAAHLTSRRKTLAVSLAVATLVYLLFGFLGAPFIVRYLLERKVAAAIHRQVAVGQVRVNPLTLSVTLRQLDVRGIDGSAFVALDEAYVNLQASSLFKWAVVLKRVRLVNPEAALVRTGPAVFNFSDIGQGGGAAAADDPGGPAVAVQAIEITGGRISLEDRVVAVGHLIDGLNLHVADLSSRPADVDRDTRIDLSARINGASLALKASARPFSAERAARAEISLRSCQVPHYLPYAALPKNIVVQTFTLETDNEIAFRMQADGRPELIVAGQTALIDVRVTDGNGEPFVHHPNLKFDLLPSTVLTGQLRFGSVETDEPEYFLTRLSSGTLYLPFLVETAYRKAEQKAQSDTAGDFLPVVTVDDLNLTRGIVHLTDRSNPTPFSATITRLDLAVQNFGLNTDRTATYTIALQSDADETAALQGTASVSPLRVDGDIRVEGIQIPRYHPYYQDRFGFKATAGRASLGGNYRIHQDDQAIRAGLTGVHLDVDTLALLTKETDAPLVSLDRLQLVDSTADLTLREITLGGLTLTGAQLFFRREKDGTLNLVEAFVPSPTATPAATGVPASPADGPSPDTATEPFVVRLNQVDLTDVTLEVEDRLPTEPVHLRMDQLALSARDLSTAPGTTGHADLSLRWEDKGRLQAGGKVTLEPLALDLAVDIDAMDIRPFQPYLSEQTGLIVTQGAFHTTGRMKLAPTDRGVPSAVMYQGDAGIRRFASIDRKNANDFLKWEALRLERLSVGVHPPAVSIDRIALADFFARVIVDAEGSLNLVSMFSRPAASTAAPQPPAASDRPSIRIARVDLSGGDVDFSDQYIKPNYSARFEDLGGQVSGLASMADKRADVLLEGLWGKHAPVKISGQINPLIEDPFVDLNLTISDIELSPFSPYSGKYIGYLVEKGKLTFDVDYLMQNRRLEGKNRIFINQLTLGDTVDSPDAVNLPVKLAVALLKDREGDIELDLPVSGSLDDPQFKIGRVVLTVLKNLIVKIVTSPFAALGALAGGGEELSYLDFDAGVSAVGPENAGKLDKLATILYERPALMLDIQGMMAPQADREALQAVLLENRLKARKLERMLKAGKSAVPLEAITLDEEERADLLEAAFEASAIAVPLDGSGKPVERTPALMERLLREHTAVSADDYRRLANARAFNAKDYLLEAGKVDRDRIFIVEPRSAAADQASQGGAMGRVVFSLK